MSKQQIHIYCDTDLIKEVDKYMGKSAIGNKSDAYRSLIKIGLDSLNNKRDEISEGTARVALESKYMIKDIYKILWDIKGSQNDNPEDDLDEHRARAEKVIDNIVK